MRVAGWLAAFYLLVAVGTRLAGAAGAHRCGCADGCWCRRPVLNTFRWVFPFGHQALDASEKERLQASAVAYDVTPSVLMRR